MSSFDYLLNNIFVYNTENASKIYFEYIKLSRLKKFNLDQNLLIVFPRNSVSSNFSANSLAEL